MPARKQPRLEQKRMMQEETYSQVKDIARRLKIPFGESREVPRVLHQRRTTSRNEALINQRLDRVSPYHR